MSDKNENWRTQLSDKNEKWWIEARDFVLGLRIERNRYLFAWTDDPRRYIALQKSTVQCKCWPKNGSNFWWLPWFPVHEVLGQHLCTGLYSFAVAFFMSLHFHKTIYSLPMIITVIKTKSFYSVKYGSSNIPSNIQLLIVNIYFFYKIFFLD